MTWRDLLFAHWPVPPETLQPLIPAGLTLDTFDGHGWLGVVPFQMTRVRPLGIPLPRDAFTFAEVNLRTYVRGADGRPGVRFLSLDGAHRAGAAVARIAFGTPYHDARVNLRHEGDRIVFAAERRGSSTTAAFRGSYRPTGPVRPAEPGSLETFLTNRLSLYSMLRGTLTRGDIGHAPWPLQPAEAEIDECTLAEASHLTLPSIPPVLHFAAHLDVVAWRPTRG
jgi:hypothetical protein